MDQIWDRNPSKSDVIGSVAEMKKLNDHAELTKVKRPKNSYVKDGIQ